MLQWFYNFLNQRFCVTSFNNCLSKHRQIHKGLPQGSISSPTLQYNDNDLPSKLKKIKNIKCALYADNLVIWTSAPQRQHRKLPLQMNQALSNLSEWCNKNEMKVNMSKTQYQIFTLCHTKSEISLLQFAANQDWTWATQPIVKHFADWIIITFIYL